MLKTSSSVSFIDIHDKNRHLILDLNFISVFTQNLRQYEEEKAIH